MKRYLQLAGIGIFPFPIFISEEDQEAAHRFFCQEDFLEKCFVCGTKKIFKPFADDIRLISKDTRYQILNEQGWKCNICFTGLKFSINSPWKGKVAHIDHIHPFSKRDTYVGSDINARINLQALCPECNMRKGDKDVN